MKLRNDAATISRKNCKENSSIDLQNTLDMLSIRLSIPNMQNIFASEYYNNPTQFISAC